MSKPTFTVLTTFHAPGYKKYASKLLQTYLEYWPKTVKLLVYAEDTIVTEQGSNLQVVDLHTTVTDLVTFKNKWKNVPLANGQVILGPSTDPFKPYGLGFRWDAVRFSNKVYAICHAAATVKTDWLLWMDADMICHAPITTQQLEVFCPSTVDICYLGREEKYSECGLYALNLRSAKTRLFLKRFQAMYDYAENGIFKQQEWHDSFIFDVVRKSMPDLHTFNWSQNIIKGEGHPLVNCEWGYFLDHLKGKRKDTGHSLTKDFKRRPSTEYWDKVFGDNK